MAAPRARSEGVPPRQELSVGSHDFTFWDYSPTVAIGLPLVCLPGLVGALRYFARLAPAIASNSFRCVVVDLPPIAELPAWTVAMKAFLDRLGLTRVHVVGIGLGGFLAMALCQRVPAYVASLALVNAFDRPFPLAGRSMLPFMPAFVVRKMVLDLLPSALLERRMVDAVDDAVRAVEETSPAALAARLMLLSTPGGVGPMCVHPAAVLLVHAPDAHPFVCEAQKGLRKRFPVARLGTLKDGGDFVQEVRAAEVIAFLLVHLTQAEAVWAQRLQEPQLPER